MLKTLGVCQFLYNLILCQLLGRVFYGIAMQDSEFKVFKIPKSEGISFNDSLQDSQIPELLWSAVHPYVSIIPCALGLISPQALFQTGFRLLWRG